MTRVTRGTGIIATKCPQNIFCLTNNIESRKRSHSRFQGFLVILYPFLYRAAPSQLICPAFCSAISTPFSRSTGGTSWASRLGSASASCCVPLRWFFCASAFFAALVWFTAAMLFALHLSRVWWILGGNVIGPLGFPRSLLRPSVRRVRRHGPLGHHKFEFPLLFDMGWTMTGSENQSMRHINSRNTTAVERGSRTILGTVSKTPRTSFHRRRLFSEASARRCFSYASGSVSTCLPRLNIGGRAFAAAAFASQYELSPQILAAARSS